MAQKEQKAPPKDEINELRGKLVQRLAVAGVLVAVLLGVLAVFDYLSNPPDESEVQVFTKPVPVAPRKEVTQPVTPATLPEPPVETRPAPAEAPPPPPKVESPAAPAPSATPAITPESRPEARPESRPESHPESRPQVRPPARPEPGAVAPAEIRPPVRPEMAPARPSTAGVVRPLVPSPPVPPATPAAAVSPAERRLPAALPAALPEDTAPPPIASAAPAGAVPPSARIAETRPAPVAPPSVQRLFSGFVLQAGVFANPHLAEELHARLALAGVPTSVETRVQVGPFRTRQEAMQAQNKLREQGIETVLVPPKGARN